MFSCALSRRSLALFAALLSGGVAAHAQTAVYGTVGIENYGFTHLSSDGVSFKGDTVGLTGGAFYDFPIQSRVHVGIDARASGSPGYKGGFYGTAALRVAFVPRRNRLRPFFELGGGVVHSSYNQTSVVSNGFSSGLVTNSQSVTSGALLLNFGLDVRLTDHLDLRLPEYGAAAGGGTGVHAGTAFFNTGVVYHFSPAQRH